MARQLGRIETPEASLDKLEAKLREKPHTQLALLMQIPGVDWVIATTIIAEIGVDMSAFVTAGHLAAWAGICPGNHQSAGKQRHGKTRRGNVYLRKGTFRASVPATCPLNRVSKCGRIWHIPRGT
jgi:transposase